MLQDNQILPGDHHLADLQSNNGFEVVYQLKVQQKASMKVFFFYLNISMMVSIPLFVLFWVFYDVKQLTKKGIIGIIFTLWCALVTVCLIFHLKISGKNVFKMLIIVDSMLVSYGIVSLVFVGVMRLIDNGQWENKILQIGFCVGTLAKLLNLRLLLVYMKWKRSQVIIYNLSLFLISLMYFGIGAVCTYFNIDFSQQRIKYFIVLFGFSSFDFMSQMIRIMGSFDYTDKFYYDYAIKDFDQQRVKHREQYIRSYVNQRRGKNYQKHNDHHHKSFSLIPVIKESYKRQQKTSKSQKLKSKSDEKLKQSSTSPSLDSMKFFSKSVLQTPKIHLKASSTSVKSQIYFNEIKLSINDHQLLSNEIP